MFLDKDANLAAIAAKFSCIILFGRPDRLLQQFRLAASGTFPGAPLLVFEKEDKKTKITLDISQELVRLNTALPESTPERPNFLVVKNAELLNDNAGNALLKTFEEARQHFVLLAEPRARLLPTILSRSAVFYGPANHAPSAQATELAHLPTADLANKLDKKPELALEVLNLLARQTADQLDQLTGAAQAILAGNNPKLAILSFL